MHVRYENVVEARASLEAAGKGLGGFFLAMHNEGVFRFFLHSSGPGQEFITVSMATETGDDLHMGFYLKLITKYFYNWFFVYYTAAQCIGCLPARHQDGIARITYSVAQVVQDAA